MIEIVALLVVDFFKINRTCAVRICVRMQQPNESPKAMDIILWWKCSSLVELNTENYACQSR